MLDSFRQDSDGALDPVAVTFSEWAQTHRSYGGEFNENALAAGIQATVAAYRRGLAASDAFEIGRQAFYAALH